MPGRGSRSSTQTVRPVRAIAQADASPVTPAPTTTTSMCEIMVGPVKVPLLDLQAQYASIRTGVLEAIARVCETQQFIMGPEVSALEGELASTIGVAHAIGVSSGTDALLVALMALGVGPGDEVVVPTFSFFATAGCVSRLGATPVFVDVDPETLMMQAGNVDAAVTPRTRAIIPVHL